MGSLIWIAAIVVTVWLMTDRRGKVKHNDINHSGLTSDEKLMVWLVCIFDPIISGAIFYYGWKKKLPKKASQANKISWMVVGIELGLLLLWFLFIGAAFTVLRSSR